MNDVFKKIIAFLKKLPLVGEWLEPKPKVAILRFAGVIADKHMHKGGISHAKFEDAIDKAFEKSNLQALALVINSPGGAPAQCSLIGNQIRKLADDKEIPVYAFVEDVAASGGYWLACIGDEIYAQDSSIVGSIGVISASLGFEDFIERYDIHRRLYTAGAEKSMLDPFLPPKAADEKRLSAIQKEIHDVFIDWVKDRRGALLKSTDKKLFEGQIWTGQSAHDLGVIDGIGQTKEVMKDKFGEGVKFVDMTPEKKVPFPLSLFTESRHPQNLAEDAIDAIETRAVWGRYGL